MRAPDVHTAAALERALVRSRGGDPFSVDEQTALEAEIKQVAAYLSALRIRLRRLQKKVQS